MRDSTWWKWYEKVWGIALDGSDGSRPPLVLIHSQPHANDTNKNAENHETLCQIYFTFLSGRGGLPFAFNGSTKHQCWYYENHDRACMWVFLCVIEREEVALDVERITITIFIKMSNIPKEPPPTAVTIPRSSRNVARIVTDSKSATVRTLRFLPVWRSRGTANTSRIPSRNPVVVVFVRQIECETQVAVKFGCDNCHCS